MSGSQIIRLNSLNILIFHHKSVAYILPNSPAYRNNSFCSKVALKLALNILEDVV